jgi:putative nucleotidyltransferase with HDIG domain
MPEREPPEKTNRLSGLGRTLRARWSRALSEKNLARPKFENAYKLALLLGLSFLIALILSPRSQAPGRNYNLGDIAPEDIRATGEFLAEDVETTAKRRRELMAKVPVVYDLDDQMMERVQEHLNQAMDFMRLNYAQVAAKGPRGRRTLDPPQFQIAYRELLKKKPEFDRLLGRPLPNASFHFLAKNGFSPQLEGLINQVIRPFFRKGMVSRNQDLWGPEAREILLRRLPAGTERLEKPPFSFISLEEARKGVTGYCREVGGDLAPADRWLVCDLVENLLVPNVTPNVAETLEHQKAALKDLRPAFFQVKRGELLVREGERLTPEKLAKLQTQNRLYPRSHRFMAFLGIFITLVLLLGVPYQLASLSLKKFSTRLRDLTFLAVILLSGILLYQGLMRWGDHLARISPEVGLNFVYFLPVGLTAILAAIFLGLETAVWLSFLSAFITGLLLGRLFPFFLYFLVGSLMGVWATRICTTRGALIKAGLYISVANLVMLTAFKLVEYPFSATDYFAGLVFAVGGGVITGILALGLTPVIESLFKYSSNIRMLEVLNLNQPILRELMLLAPGTYHHSMVVGQMVEAAAEAIGANPLLAKTAAFYHDIGKIKKPAYFVENQVGGDNKHEKLAPSMSGLILISHVKDGVELARKHRLGENLADIIRQHHGTSLISYFYQKAKTKAGSSQQVNIQDFRYPGPRPQTKEAGLVLLADQVEAASKSLVDPTPARIQGMVQKIINNIFADGQLDECELTLKDLHHIAKSFNKILGGIHHQRIDYPLPVDKKRANGDLDKQPAKKNNGKSAEDQEKRREDLKRLGMA